MLKLPLPQSLKSTRGNLVTTDFLSTCAATLLPPELLAPQQYNTTVHLQWGHFLSQRGRSWPSDFVAESSAKLMALRSTQCLVMHSAGLNFSEARSQNLSSHNVKYAKMRSAKLRALQHAVPGDALC